METDTYNTNRIEHSFWEHSILFFIVFQQNIILSKCSHRDLSGSLK